MRQAFCVYNVPSKLNIFSEHRKSLIFDEVDEKKKYSKMFDEQLFSTNESSTTHSHKQEYILFRY